MDPTGGDDRIEFASIVLGRPEDMTQSLLYSQSETRIRQHAMREFFRGKGSTVHAPVKRLPEPQWMLTGKFRSKPSLKRRCRKSKASKSEVRAGDDGVDMTKSTERLAFSPTINGSSSDPFQVFPVTMTPSEELLLRLRSSFLPLKINCASNISISFSQSDHLGATPGSTESRILPSARYLRRRRSGSCSILAHKFSS